MQLIAWFRHSVLGWSLTLLHDCRITRRNCDSLYLLIKFISYLNIQRILVKKFKQLKINLYKFIIKF